MLISIIVLLSILVLLLICCLIFIIFNFLLFKIIVNEMEIIRNILIKKEFKK